MTFILIAIGLIGWSLAAAFAALAWSQWRLVGEWRYRADHFRQALRACDKQLREELEAKTGWDGLPTPVEDPPDFK